MQFGYFPYALPGNVTVIAAFDGQLTVSDSGAVKRLPRKVPQTVEQKL
jgi:hypothetical protein